MQGSQSAHGLAQSCKQPTSMPPHRTCFAVPVRRRSTESGIRRVASPPCLDNGRICLVGKGKLAGRKHAYDLASDDVVTLLHLVKAVLSVRTGENAALWL